MHQSIEKKEKRKCHGQKRENAPCKIASLPHQIDCQEY